MDDALERRALVLILGSSFLLTSGGVLAGPSDWELVVRLLAILAFLTAVILSLGILVAGDIAQRLPPKRSLFLGAVAAVGVGVLLTGVGAVSSTLDLIDQSYF